MTVKIRIDTGGTFTDCWAEQENGTVSTVKILSSARLRVRVLKTIDSARLVLGLPENWNTPAGFFRSFTVSNHLDETSTVVDFCEETGTITIDTPIGPSEWIDLYTGEEAPVLGARLLTGTGLVDAFPPLDFRLATTRGTNALLERKGAPLALFITRGFGDLLEIGDQRRPDLFALRHDKRKMIYREVIEVGERLAADGSVVESLDLSAPAFQEAIDQQLASGINTAAVVLLHAYKNPVHEEQLRRHLLDRGFQHVSISSELAPLVKILPRAETAVTNAYLHEVLQEFLNEIEKAVGGENAVYTMTSAGGLEPVHVFRPKDSLLSGPAGGVAGAAAIARELGIEKILTFDMGGTSTDVARYDGGFIYRFEQLVGDARLLSTSLKIETVASGGGSICQWTSAGLRVGPESAGANPGPACYGRGGPLTITDVNLLLNRIDPENFGIPLSEKQIDAAKIRALELQSQAGLSGRELDHTFLEGLVDIAVEQMSDAIRTISIRDGADPAEFALLAFGGAGPLHACAIAERLGISQIIIPGEAGILSAYGLEQSSVARIAEQQINLPLDRKSDIEKTIERVMEEARGDLRDLDLAPARVRCLAEVRLEGQDSTLTLESGDSNEFADLFRAEYEKIFGYTPPSHRPIEIVSFRAIASTASPPPRKIEEGTLYPSPSYSVPNTVPYTVPSRFVDRGALKTGSKIDQPCVIQDPFSTLFLAENWSATALSNGSLWVERNRELDVVEKTAEKPIEISRELFRHRFGQVVEEMGAMLQRSSISTNVKERLDFSCALLDADGKLIVSAHHIPVHLGAMGLCVRKVKETLPIRRGDTIITNHPGIGGSHLPDITLITPVFAADGEEPIAYLANRAHHAELGGIAPGSMPPNARNLAEEGVVIAPRYLIERGESLFQEVELLLKGSTYPSRRVADNIADLHAQAAANRRGLALLEGLMDQYGAKEISNQLAFLYSSAETALTERLKAEAFAGGKSVQVLDDGSSISVSIEKSGNRLVVDFEGTAHTHPGNLNATPAIVESAILYVLRLWTQSSLPLNEGLISRVDIRLPECFLNPKFDSDPNLCPAVVGGNVETSQRLVDALVEALGLQACSQGTMNNLIFGDDSFGYYETICGGAGAGDGYDGASALHTHMTNTAITDPEILESRYPVRLNEFSIRRGSGGAGLWRGGDGVVRELTFLKPLEISLLTQHRKEVPFGMRGGDPGKRGEQFVDGERVDGIVSLSLETGQTLRMETPGGGGFGTAPI